MQSVGLPEKEEEEKEKEKVKAPMTLTNALSAVRCHKTHLPYFSQCILQKNTPGPTKTTKSSLTVSLNPLLPNKLNISFSQRQLNYKIQLIDMKKRPASKLGKKFQNCEISI